MTKNLLQLEKNVDEVAAILRKEKILSPDVCKKLSQQLDDSSSELQDLVETANNLDDLAEKKIKHLQDKIISLYGEIENHLFDYEVSEIVKGASDLDSLIKKGDREKIAQKTSALKERLNVFHSNYRPAGDNFKMVSEAEGFINHVASSLAKSKGLSDEATLSLLRKTSFKREVA